MKKSVLFAFSLFIAAMASPTWAQEKVYSCDSGKSLTVTREFVRIVGNGNATIDLCRFEIAVKDAQILDQLLKNDLAARIENGIMVISAVQNCDNTTNIHGSYRRNSVYDDNYDFNDYGLSLASGQAVLTAKHSINGQNVGGVVSFQMQNCR